MQKEAEKCDEKKAGGGEDFETQPKGAACKKAQQQTKAIKTLLQDFGIIVRHYNTIIRNGSRAPQQLRVPLGTVFRGPKGISN